ncbi:MAG: HAD family hydrolase [Lachnospiraceae bacterium]|nr:HAD family hydrolase [Lachnospiraceae bacterium]
MKYRLLCIDIDGTLLDDSKQIPEQVIKAIQRAAGLGLKVALITGRMPAATDFIAKELQIPCIYACNAGTYILEDDKCISVQYMAADTMEELYNVIKKYEIPLWIFRGRKWYVTGMDDFVKEEIELIHYVPEIEDAEMLAAKWRKEKTGPNKVLIGAMPETVQKIYAELKSINRQDIDMACSSEYFLEIFPKGMNKGKALMLICEKEGIRREETIAFGDQELDIPMLEAAGIGVAMGNAIEELKQKADFITKTNNEAGIAYALDYYLNQEEKTW